MRDYDEHTITDAVIEQMAQTQSPRTRAIMTSLVRHLHDFVRDVRPSFAEWEHAIDFLTRTGQKCTNVRQEFIILSDTLGVSMLMEALNYSIEPGATESTVLGPFFVSGLPTQLSGTDIAGGMRGQPLYVRGQVLDGSGRPVPGAVVETWHSDEDGFYDVQRPDLATPAGRGRFETDAEGRFSFWSVMPYRYPVPTDGPAGEMLRATARHPFRPAHVHFMVDAPRFNKLVTHLFVANDPFIDSDVVFAVRDSLIADFPEHSPGTAPDGRTMVQPWRQLDCTFQLTAVATAAAA